MSALSAQRTVLAQLYFGVFGSEAGSRAELNGNKVEIYFRSDVKRIGLGRIRKVEVNSADRWSVVTLGYAGGELSVSGLGRKAGAALASGLEAARANWWKKELGSRRSALIAVKDGLDELGNPRAYVSVDAMESLVQGAQAVQAGFVGHWPESVSDVSEVRMLKAAGELLKEPEEARKRANEAFVAKELIRSAALFDRIESRPLTDEQRRAVVVDDKRNLVVAAAGSGKTSVIVAKVGWLLTRGYRGPSELLVLAFAREVRKEMEERVRKRVGAAARDVCVRTFHSLGMAIIGDVEGKRPALARVAEDKDALLDLLTGIVGDLLKEREIPESLLRWFQGQFAPYKSQHEFSSWGAYWNYIRANDVRSLKGDKVRSYEECEIANFFYLNGVRYEYERPYEYETATAGRRQYKPDFFLPDYGIYVEHFGVDAAGNTAPYIDGKKYREDMEWKRGVHREKGTVLVETFTHERSEGRLLRNLESKLGAHGVVLAPVTGEQVFALLNEKGVMEPFIGLVAKFLQHFKGSRKTMEEVVKQAWSAQGSPRAILFLTIFGAIYDRYEETLAAAGEIDFHDMIARATGHVEAGRYRCPFGYILVDEFQDISVGRARLLKALLDSVPGSQLFAVGDDWQAIYRFSGSDISVMREFGEWFGEFERSDLATTFRCAEGIAEVATDFVLRNPAQISKTVRALHVGDGPTVHVGLPSDDGLRPAKEALERIKTDAAGYDGVSEVLLLGRYRRLKPGNLRKLNELYPWLRFRFMTVHAAKGQEADYVVVLGLHGGKYGFPVGIEDDSLLDLVMAASEPHPNAEERRLFYVALTRAKRQVYLLAGDVPSSFVDEVLEDGDGVAVFGRDRQGDVACSRCEEGRLVRRQNKKDRGIFYSCSNRPLCEFTASPCPECGVGLVAKTEDEYRCRNCDGVIEGCPECDGWLMTRMGKYGRFVGCSNFPSTGCSYKRKAV